MPTLNFGANSNIALSTSNYDTVRLDNMRRENYGTITAPSQSFNVPIYISEKVKPHFNFIYLNDKYCDINQYIEIIEHEIKDGVIISFYLNKDKYKNFTNNFVKFDYSYAIIGENKQNFDDILVAIMESENLW